MIILEFIILLIGLFISLLSLQKKDSKRKNTSKRVLAFSYITLFIVSIIVILIKSEDATKSGLKLFNTLHNIEKQSDTLVTLLDSISVLKNRMDIIFSKTEEAIIQREQSQKIFDEQNKLLEKSNELTQKQLVDTKPDVTIYTHNINFLTEDSITIKFNLTFVNEGQRVARNFKHLTVQFYRNKINDKYFTHFISFSSGMDIYPSKMLVTEKPLTLNYQDFYEQTSGGIIIISFSYFDDLLSDRIENQLCFRFETGIDTIKVFKENKIPNDLQTYVSKNKIDLTID